MKPLDLLSSLVESAFVDDDVRAEWRSFTSEIGVEGWLDELDEHDALGVVTIVFVDLSANPDGSHYLRWRSELLERNDTDEVGVLFGGNVHDPPAVAKALASIASSVSKAAPAGHD